MADNFSHADLFWGNGHVAAPQGEELARHWNWLKAQTGNTHPGALAPFGWVSVLPYSGAYSSGYGCNGVSSDGITPQVSDRPAAFGFTHFHATGTGFLGEFYNYFLIQAFCKGSDYRHISELTDIFAEPGYFSGTLADYGVNFELTAGKFAALHRYQFAQKSGKVTIDTTQMGLNIPIEGYHESIYSNHCVNYGNNWYGGFIYAHEIQIFYAVKVSGNITRQAALNGVIEYDITGSNAESVIAFSLTSMEDARQRAEEAAAQGFDKIKIETQSAWREILNSIQATFATEKEYNIFCSALYHSLIKPVDTGKEFTDFQTLWDIYRTQLPLMMMIAPQTAGKMLRSMMQTAKRIGFFPSCYMMSSNYHRHDMQATALAVNILSDGFFQGILNSSDYPELKAFFKLEFSHASTEGKSPTHILDLACAANAAGQVARSCQDNDFARELYELSKIWRKAYDEKTGLLIADAVYYEGDNWNYSFRPHPQMKERVALSGGEEQFEKLLDRFFGFGCTDTYSSARPMIPNRFEGMNNESDMETPAAYLWCGRADKQAKIHDNIRRYMFFEGSGGCPGNNDSGGLSSWYVLSTLGLYPLTGTPYCLLTSPSVKKASIKVAGGILNIEVERESETAIYPAGYQFNGEDFHEPYIPLEKLLAGGVLKFVLKDTPQEQSIIPDWL